MREEHSKIQRLVDIARAYYEDNRTQQEIARRFGISRPLVSRLLTEAREAGIVTIRINEPWETNIRLRNQLVETFGLNGATPVPEGGNINVTNEAMAEAVITLIKMFHNKRFGVGWGTMVGVLAQLMDSRPPMQGIARSFCPLIGNGGFPNRNYHSNEIVRIFAQSTASQPVYWHSPAFAESETEAQHIRELENSRALREHWRKLEVAIVNIGNYPSVPDLATRAQFQDLLIRRRAVGRLLSYYFDIDGDVIHPETDLTMQIPLDILRRCPAVIGVCAANATPETITGALRSGCISHIIVPVELATRALAIARKSAG
ncbi:MAG: MarR family transcriptional regulator [Methylobacteriaceae bacterium]|jgi:DNA-binding transcriptional regulator LsrR (DeoR family)|nr:MarR family transcriptional regulator [Methylobacteriaceae bacterium]